MQERRKGGPRFAISVILQIQMESNNYIANCFVEQFTKHVSKSWSRTISLRRHKRRLETYGEYSFEVSPEWSKGEHAKSRIPRTDDEPQTLARTSDEAGISENAFAGILEASKSWTLVISRCQLKDSRVCVYLDKTQAFKSILHTILSLKECYGRHSSNNTEMLVLADALPQDLDLSEWRVLLLRDVVSRLLDAVGYVVLKDGAEEQEHIHVTSRLSRPCNSACSRVSVGVVLDADNGRRGHTCAQEYIKRRYEDVQRTAEHKRDDKLVEHLAEASVKMDLLYVKPSHTISINGAPCSKGACFVLYNCARLTAIMKQFEEKVSAGYYPPLVPLSEVDFSTLNKEEEWEMLFVHLMQYPDIVKQAALSPHYICIFLLTLSSAFSVYYRRVRILTECRSQMLPVMFARLYLLQAIQQVLHNALSLLDIAPVDYM